MLVYSISVKTERNFLENSTIFLKNEHYPPSEEHHVIHIYKHIRFIEINLWAEIKNCANIISLGRAKIKYENEKKLQKFYI